MNMHDLILAHATPQAMAKRLADISDCQGGPPAPPLPEIFIVDSEGRRVATATGLRRTAPDIYEVLVDDAVMGLVTGLEASMRTFGLPIIDARREVPR